MAINKDLSTKVDALDAVVNLKFTKLNELLNRKRPVQIFDLIHDSDYADGVSESLVELTTRCVVNSVNSSESRLRNRMLQMVMSAATDDPKAKRAIEKSAAFASDRLPKGDQLNFVLNVLAASADSQSLQVSTENRQDPNHPKLATVICRVLVPQQKPESGNEQGNEPGNEPG